jgi:hypothetical protein
MIVLQIQIQIQIQISSLSIRKVMRQLPDAEMLHVSERSPTRG